MHLQTKQNQRSRYGGNDVGKNICISFGFHELDLIDDLDILAHSECINRSQWIRRRIREEIQNEATGIIFIPQPIEFES